MRLHVHQSPRARQRRMIGRRVLQCQTEVRSQAQGVLDPPGHPPLGIDPLEVTDEQRAEVHTRCQSRTPESVGVERLATLLGELVEAMLRQQAVQPFIKHVTRRLRQCLRHHEQPLLTLLLPPSHRHRNHLREFLINHRDDSLAPFSFPSTVSSDFHHGLLGSSPVEISCERPSSGDWIDFLLTFGDNIP